MEMSLDLREVEASALRAIEEAQNKEALESIRVHYLGRKGLVTGALRSLKDFAIEERREIGPRAQSLKRTLEERLGERLAELGESGSPAERLPDFTAPGKRFARGRLHPLTLVDRDIRRIFTGLNFSVVEGPEVETEHYNFDALNIPEYHPAREMWDTFWLKRNAGGEKLLLRTHTSPVQVRYMEAHRPPLQIIVPGRVFRYEATDASHEVNFYQLEGLMVGKAVSLANFKFIVEAFFKRFFRGQRIEFRYRPSYFPFTEPSVEVDVKLGNKWLEVMGAGMVHPRVFEYAHYNPRDWQGFAFGCGIDRLAMIRYKIPDIRLFYSGDVRFVKQF